MNKDFKIRKEYISIIKKSSDELGVSPSELLDYLLTQELNYAVVQHEFRNEVKKCPK